MRCIVLGSRERERPESGGLVVVILLIGTVGTYGMR